MAANKMLSPMLCISLAPHAVLSRTRSGSDTAKTILSQFLHGYRHDDYLNDGLIVSNQACSMPIERCCLVLINETCRNFARNVRESL
jgi:hypothetical protein